MGINIICVSLYSGVFSETHVLSMIYLGEMCYWHTKYTTESSSSSTDSFNPKELGCSVLNTYLSVVNGPLKNHGWSTDRADQLLQLLQCNPEETDSSQ